MRPRPERMNKKRLADHERERSQHEPGVVAPLEEYLAGTDRGSYLWTRGKPVALCHPIHLEEVDDRDALVEKAGHH